MNLVKNNFIFYLLFLTPFLIIPGIVFVEISVMILTIIFFLKNKDSDYFKDQRFLFLILFSIYIALNAMFQINDNLKLSSLFFFRFCLLSLSIFFFIKFRKKYF